MGRAHIELTDEQRTLVQNLKHWYQTGDRQWYSYTGAAGTGKTTVIRAFIEELGIERYIACAYVGKAVSVLSRQGLPASTIHSMIYNVMWLPDVGSDGEIIFKPDGKMKMHVEFALKDRIRGDPQLIIVDEATMVNDRMAEDILSFGIPTVFLGDMNQLPPVFGVSSVMLAPNFRLTKIMRQAENDPIVYIANQILNRQPIPFGQYGKSSVRRVIPLGENYRDYDMIITPLNSVRDDVNNYIRHKVLNIRGDVPVIGDKLICRQNDWERSVDGNLFLTTGLVGEVTNINRSLAGDKYMNIDFLPDIADEEFYNLMIDVPYIKKSYDERKYHGFSSYEKFEYAYACTVHMVQGSQYGRVLYIDRWFHDAEMTRKVRYTAATRAIYGLDWACDVEFTLEAA